MPPARASVPADSRPTWFALARNVSDLGRYTESGDRSSRSYRAASVFLVALRSTSESISAGFLLGSALQLEPAHILPASTRIDTDQSVNQTGGSPKASRSLLPQLLGYSHKSLETDLDRALGTTTGAFHDDYQRVLKKVVEREAAKQKIDTSVVIDALGVVRASTDRVVVLAFLTQKTSTAQNLVPSVTGSRVEVTLIRSSGHWLISGLRPL